MNCTINNNAFEVDPSPRNKRKRTLQCTNAFMNPALDLLATEDTICNNTMEIVPVKRARRSKSCDDRATFENPALDLGLQQKAVHGLLRKHLNNVNDKLTSISENGNISSILEEKSLQYINVYRSPKNHNSTPMVYSNYPMRRSISFDLSFIEKIDVDDNVNEGLYLDDDLNESNIMEIKTITRVNVLKPTAHKTVNTNPFLDDISFQVNEELSIPQNKVCRDFPFDIPTIKNKPFDDIKYIDDEVTAESIYDATSDVTDPEIMSINSPEEQVLPRRLFANDSDIVSECIDEYPNILHNQSLANNRVNKQSKILGCDVTNMTQKEIFNQMDNNTIQRPIQKNGESSCKIKKCKLPNASKSGNKISSKILNTIKDIFKPDKKTTHKNTNVGGNPYEVKRPTTMTQDKNRVICGFENPALNLNSTDVDAQETDDETSPAARNHFKITPTRFKNLNLNCDKENVIASQNSIFNEHIDLSDVCNKKQVRFDSTLNQEKLITGSSFDSNMSNGSSFSRTDSFNDRVFNEIDTQIDDYHNELENCFNEKKLIAQHIS